MKKKLKEIFIFVVSKLKLKNIIVMEGMNDFESNTGVFFDYLIKNNCNEKYKFIWLLKDSNNKKKIKNTIYYNYNKINIFQKIKIATAKYLIYDNCVIEKYNKKQVSIYLTHGFPILKKVKGVININDKCDYFLCTSKQCIELAKDQFGVSDKQIVINGLPRNDQLFENNNEINKIIGKEKYSKIIMWMPTFRKFYMLDRNDSSAEYELGIPLIYNIDDYNKLNEYLKDNNTLLIIKFHPGQDLSVIKIKDLSNIKLFSSNEMLKQDIHLYKLLNNIDALISDYSSVYFDYLLLDRQIGFVVDDINQYKIGFAFDDVYSYMPGLKIKNLDNL